MTDQELLELAAKAAGLELNGTYNFKGVGLRHGAPLSYWNPLAHNDEAFWLAVRLNIDVSPWGRASTPHTRASCSGLSPTHAVEEHCDDPYAATRRAIVRAAAEIGRKMS